MSQPNIVLIMADQLAAPFLGPYGDTTAIAPAIDKLAAEGVVFETAYSNSPLCAPARFSMMSGQLNSKIAAYDNASEFPSSIPTFAHHLRSAGYQTSLVGKMHFVGADQLHGFEERLTTDIYPADFGWTPNWADPTGRFDWWFHNMDSVTNAGVAEVSNQLDYDDEVGFKAVRKIRDLARTSDERPFFLTVSFTHPHDPYVARREHWDRYDHAGIPLPDVGPIADEVIDPHSRRLRHVISADVAEVSDEQIRNARHAYYANISYLDDFVEEITSTLAALDLDDTIVIFTSDHGDMLGERGLWYKMNFFEHAARVPLIVRAPGLDGGQRVTTTVSLLDIAPTLLDLAGIELSDDVADDLDGASILSFIDEPDDERTVLGEYLGEGAIAPVLMIRRGRWKYISAAPDPAQLYDLVSDPFELENLAERPEHTSVAAAFAAEVVEQWNADELRDEILSNQRRRATVDKALRRGRFAAWDFQPTTDATSQYMRNHLDLNDVESGRRA